MTIKSFPSSSVQLQIGGWSRRPFSSSRSGVLIGGKMPVAKAHKGKAEEMETNQRMKGAIDLG